VNCVAGTFRHIRDINMSVPPSQEKVRNKMDSVYIKSALKGDTSALNELIERHYTFTFNVCLKMLYSHHDAEDVNNEIWIKIISRLSSFNFKSAFKTWLYRIAVNHILDMKKKSIELAINGGFDGYKKNLESIPTHELNGEEVIILSESINEAKIGCMSGMLMCLDREQRLIYVMGDIFGIDHTLGSEIFDLSLSNYRKKLSRARTDLFSFMNDQCSLVNKNNPCSCNKKTKGFIGAGYVNPEKLEFFADYKIKIHDKLADKSDQLDNLSDDYHTRLFQAHPFEETKAKKLLNEVLKSTELKALLRL